MPGAHDCSKPLKPLAGDGRKRSFDPSTGNMARDGYTATGARRPLSRKPGEIVDGETADRIDSFEADMEGFRSSYPSPYSDE